MNKEERTKQVAVARLIFPDGKVLKNQVLVFDEGRFVRHFPLVKELPCTTWLGREVYYNVLLKMGKLTEDCFKNE